MRAKLAACDSCRFAKLACDHAKPVCGRCQKRDSASTCTYRTRPFKKKPLVERQERDAISQRQLPTQETQQVLDSVDLREDVLTTSRPYPNPGYLGSSSHTTIFHQLDPVLNQGTASLERAQTSNLAQTLEPSIDEYQLLDGAKLIEDILKLTHLKSCHALVDHWTSKGQVNFALAGTLTKTCTQSAADTLSQLDGSIQAIQELSMKLFINSCKSITVNERSAIEDFSNNFCQGNIRWETIGLFFTAVSRATTDMTEFPPLFGTEQQRKALRRATMRYADRCLDLAMSLDCLNDLQLILQYETFINHSFADGDQSYHSWKRLGDVTSSVLALGYHEEIDFAGSCPEFLRCLRRATVARVYSADKNVAIFLGRPPRMDRRYCTFDFVNAPGVDDVTSSPGLMRYFGWNSTKPFDYVVDTWWSFECALLKEEIVQLQYEMNFHRKIEKAGEIKGRAESRWLSLPQKYQYSGDLRLHYHQPIERDFVASARLNYLHVLFLLRLASIRQILEQDNELLSISAEMLQLSARIAVMKDRLTFSGTGTIWKICHYGMPATGILCLSLLKPPYLAQQSGVSRATVIQDLSVLVAQVDTGILIDSSDSNYALLSAATRTIQAILDKTLSNNTTTNLTARPQSGVSYDTAAGDDDMNWLPWSNDDGWDFELDFWTNLAEHPVLTADETIG